jgi:two-component system phosphate regulon response regulator PhoB
MDGPVLIVDGDPVFAERVEASLRAAGFDTVRANGADDALQQIAAGVPALVLLEVELPTGSGLDVCRRLRAQPEYEHLPVIFITSRGSETDRVAGLEAGADDYVVKPVHPRELILRVRAVLRRAAPPKPSALTAGPFTLDGEGLHVQGKRIDATAVELRLIRDLMQHVDQLRTREELLSAVWSGSPSSRALDTHLARLRIKLGPAKQLVETVRGVGYRLVTLKPRR